MASEAARKGQVRLTQSSPRCMRVRFDNPPLSGMGPEFVLELGETVDALEADALVEVLVFGSAVEASGGSVEQDVAVARGAGGDEAVLTEPARVEDHGWHGCSR